MKKLVSILMVLACICTLNLNVEAKAENTSTQIEYLEDGSYYITEVVELNQYLRTVRSGKKVLHTIMELVD